MLEMVMSVQPPLPSMAATCSRPPDLPNFERPPVTEVYLSIQFGSLTGFRSGHVGLLWSKFRDQYPKILEQMPLQPVFESFGAPTEPTPSGFQIQVESLLAPPVSRYWFLDDNEDELIQIQQDRIIHNWRKTREDQVYPRYEVVRDKFKSELDIFLAFINEEKLGELKPNQCEVSYTNLIELPDSANPHHHLERISCLWAGAYSEPIPFELENVTAQARYIIRDGGKSIGRVHVNLAPAYRVTDKLPIIRAEFLARGKPNDDSIEATFQLLDQERDAIVRTFAAVTTPSMHEMWGRNDGH
jgi:uncharacterized protein (TIGR04255 family)